jgi:hypothetical protein
MLRGIGCIVKGEVAGREVEATVGETAAAGGEVED